MQPQLLPAVVRDHFPEIGRYFITQQREFGFINGTGPKVLTPDPKTWERARQILCDACEHTWTSYRHGVIPPTDTTCTVDGVVAFTWRTERATLTLTVPADDGYALYTGECPTAEVKKLSGRIKSFDGQSDPYRFYEWLAYYFRA